MKPMLCTQCGAPLKGEKCEYCDVKFADAPKPEVDFPRMSRLEFWRCKQLMQDPEPEEVELMIECITDPREVQTQGFLNKEYYDKKLLENLQPYPNDWPSATQSLFMRNQLISKLKKHTLKDTVRRMHELLQKIRIR